MIIGNPGLQLTPHCLGRPLFKLRPERSTGETGPAHLAISPAEANHAHPLIGDIITEDSFGSYGAKEASEGAMVSSPSSVFRAIHHATGMWFKEQLITPEKVVMALKRKNTKS